MVMATDNINANYKPNQNDLKIFYIVVCIICNIYMQYICNIAMAAELNTLLCTFICIRCLNRSLISFKKKYLQYL